MCDEMPLDRQILPFFFDLRIGRLAGALLACERSQSVRRGWFDHASTYSCAAGVSVQIVDDSGRCLPAGQEGTVRIASEVAVDHYFEDPEMSSEFFRDGWFYPGDLGSLTSENLLIISGRSSSVLNAGGGKLSAEKIEAALMSFKGVSEAAVFMATGPLGVEEVWAGIVCSEKIDSERLRAHCRQHMPAIFVPAHIVTLDALPINATGKVDRPRLKEIVLRAARS